MNASERRRARGRENACACECERWKERKRKKEILRAWDMQRKSRRIICKRIYWQNLNILPILRDLSVKRRKEKMIFI